MQCPHKICVPVLSRKTDENGNRIQEHRYVPCGKCPACLRNASQGWALRLIEEWKASTTACFVTLTYEPGKEYINENGIASVNKRDFQLFMKRLRKRYGNGMRYFCISEYGDTTFRPHYHMLLFNYPYRDWLILRKEICETWQNANMACVHATPVNAARIGYCSNYGAYHKQAPAGADANFMLSSRRPGIGFSFMDSRKPEALRERFDTYVRNRFGTYALPSYYRNRIVDDEFKELAQAKYEEYTRKRNKALYGVEELPKRASDVSKETDADIRQKYDNWLESVKAYESSFRKKQKHKHSK